MLNYRMLYASSSFWVFLFLALGFGLFAGPSLQAQQRIEVADFTESPRFFPKRVYSLRWMANGRRYSVLEDNKIVIYDVATGEPAEVLLDGNTLSESITLQDYELSPDENMILLLTQRESIYRYSYTAIYYLYKRSDQSLRLLAPGRQAYATFSPDNRMLAYTRDNNLFYQEISTGKEVQVSDDGRAGEIINGSADWVYEEELSLTRAFEWSKDSKRLAYYKFDESAVKSFQLQFWQGTNPYPLPYQLKYPKAGEANAKVQLFIRNLETNKDIPVVLGQKEDVYYPRIRWTEDPALLSVERLNRLQNLREVIHVDALSGIGKVVYTEKSDTYVDLTFCDDLRYLKDGKHFVYSSEEEGFKHFYLHDMSGKRLRAITSGNYEAETLLGIDESNPRKPVLYYLSNEGNFMEKHLFKVKVKGGGKTMLTQGSGVHSILMSRDFSHYIDLYSAPEQVLQVRLYNLGNGNKEVSLLKDNAELSQAIKDYGFVSKEFFSFTNEANNLLYGYLLKPKDMEAGKRYPCVVYQYSGPGAQSVRKNWGGSHYAFHQMLVQRGIVVAVVDTRGTGGRGAAFKKGTYGQMGKYESMDLISTARYLSQLPYVDTKRLGIWGWSYGGYMSSLSLFLEGSPYSVAIAVAPVGSWRFYDTIYTERYLKLPQENAAGYDDYSPISHAHTMRGKYLLIHGTGDDNVHFQNAIAIQDALVKKGKQFDTFYYPNEAHSLRNVRTHLYEMMANYFVEHLIDNPPTN